MASRKRRQNAARQWEGVMGRSNVEYGAAAGEMPCHASSDHDPVRRFFAVLPRPLRFLGVGGLGLITDLAVFTLIIAQTPHPLLARLALARDRDAGDLAAQPRADLRPQRPPHRR